MPFAGRLAREESYPAGEPGVSSRFVTTRSGVRVRVCEAEATASASAPRRGRPGTVLLVHGWGCHAYVFRHLIPALAAAGYRVVAPDLKGHGQSDKPRDAAGYTLGAMADHLGEIMDALGLASVHALVAHSLGGAVALGLTLRVPGRAERLVLFAPVGLGRVSADGLGRAVTPRWMTPLLPYLAARWLFRLIMWGAYGPEHRFTERDLDEYWAPSRSPDFVPALRQLLHAFDWGPRDATELGALRVPALVVFGQADRVVSPDRCERYAAAMPDGRARIEPRAGHVLPEEMPERAIALTLGFLGESPGTTGRGGG